jgi:hypothetical protein
MIRDEMTAKTALDLMNKAHALLMDSLRLVKQNCLDEEFRAFQAEIAQVLGHLFFLLMEPIYREHPTLAPADTPKEFIERWHKKPSDQE